MDWEAADPARQARADAARPAPRSAPPRTTTDEWPALGLCSVLDELRDAVVATDELGQIRYVNEAAEKLMGWPPGSLIGRSALDIVADSVAEPLEDGFEDFVRTRAPELLGRRLPTVIKRADGSEVDTELVLSMFDHESAGPVMVGIFRPHDDKKLQRWSQLTTELLEIMQDAPIDDPPAERLLSTLGRRLGWDMTALWTVTPRHDLVCHHAWVKDPDAGSWARRAMTTTARTTASAPTAEASSWPVSSSRRAARSGSPTSPRMPVAPSTPSPPGACAASTPSPSCTGAPASAWSSCSAASSASATAPWSTSWTRWPATWASCLHASALQAERESLVEELLEARRRSEFLLLAAQVLSEFVDYGEMVERLARVSVPVLADLCLIDLEDDDKQMRRMAAWHADPAKRPLAEELKSWYAPLGSGNDPIMQVMRTGHSMWSAEMSDEFLQAACRDTRHYSILKELGLQLVHDGALAHPRGRGDRHGLPRVVRLGPALLREGPRPGRAAGQAGRFGGEPGPGLRPRTPDLPRAPAQPPARRHPGRGRVGRSRRATGPPRPATRWAATGTTWCRSPTTWWLSWSVTSRGTT